jgi:hypothetical protein
MRDGVSEARPQADNADYDQIDRNDVVEEAGHEENQYAGDQCDERLDHNDV